MAPENFNTIFLDGLIRKLKALNYNVSVEHVLQIHSLFLSLSLSEIKTGGLKYLITPLLAKTKDEQEQIYRVIDEYVMEKIAYAGPPAAPVAGSPGKLKFYTLPRGASQSPPAGNIILVIGAVIFILLVGILIFRPAKTIRYENLPVITKTDSIQNDVPPPVNTTPVNVEPSVTINKQPVNNNTGFTVQSLHAIEAKEQNVNVQLSIILGLIAGVILSFIVFTVKEKEYLPEEENKNKVTVRVPEKNVEPQDKPATGQMPGPGVSIPAVVTFANNNHLISECKNIASIKKNMKKYYTGNMPVFNIKGSIAKTAESAGFFSPVYGYRKEQRKYLALVDGHNEDGHMFKQFSFFIQSFLTAGIHIEKYTYGKDINTLHDSQGSTVLLSGLAASTHGCHLLVFGDGKRLVDEKIFRGSIQTAGFWDVWPSRSVITTVSIADWAGTETQLQAMGFAVVPAETDAVDLLIKHITGKQEISKGFLNKQLKNIYPVEGFDFETPEGIYAYLNDERLFQLVCALSVYPVLDWNLTLALYNNIIRHNKSGIAMHGSDYNALLKLARMPFLNTAVLSDALRLALLNNLDARTEITARQTIHAALEESKLSVPVNSAAYSQLMAQLLINEFFLYAHDRKKFKKFASSKKLLLTFWQQSEDQVMKDYIKSGRAKLLPENKPGQHITVEEFMVMEKEKEVRKITFLRVLVTGIPALFIYLFLIIFKPAYAYPPDKEIYGQTPITVQVKKDICSDTITSVKLYGNTIDSIMSVNISDTHSKEIYLDHMDYGDPVTVEYIYNGVKKTATISCRDSLYIITINNCLKK